MLILNWRPDRIMETGVIEFTDIKHSNPVDKARAWMDVIAAEAGHGSMTECTSGEIQGGIPLGGCGLKEQWRPNALYGRLGDQRGTFKPGALQGLAEAGPRFGYSPSVSRQALTKALSVRQSTMDPVPPTPPYPSPPAVPQSATAIGMQIAQFMRMMSASSQLAALRLMFQECEKYHDQDQAQVGAAVIASVLRYVPVQANDIWSVAAILTTLPPEVLQRFVAALNFMRLA